MLWGEEGEWSAALNHQLGALRFARMKGHVNSPATQEGGRPVPGPRRREELFLRSTSNSPLLGTTLEANVLQDSLLLLTALEDGG